MTLIHPTNIIGRNVSIQPRVVVWQFTTIEDDVSIGTNCVIGSNCWIGKGTSIGEGTRIQHGAFIARGSLIGKQVFIGPCAVLTDDRYPRAGHSEYEANPPVLEDNCSIGAGAVILPGVTIGENAMIGAGAVVIENVMAHNTAVGVPAVERPIEGGVVWFEKVNREGFGID
jgi:UDP-2-acetamido-3-amino-2,3-dideoxy-glucuronate N-acetyltransferase